MRVRRTLAVAFLSAAVALTGCGSTDDATDDEVDTTSDVDDTTEEATVDDDGNTLPGAELEIGEWAQVPYSALDFEGTLRLRLVSVDEATLDDFNVFGESTVERVEGATPFYFTIEVEKVDGNELAFSDINTDFRTIDADGERVQDFSAIGTFEPCNTQSFPREIDEDPDFVLVTCLIGLEMPDGEVPAGVAFGPRDTDYAHFDGDPIIWL